MKKYAIVLAAGKGARMLSRADDYSKVSYPILGKPLVNYVIDALKPLGIDELYVVVGFGGEKTISVIKEKATIVWQKEVLGTGHAVMQVLEHLKDKEGDVIIVNGDTPLLTPDTLKKVYHKHEKSDSDLTICSTVLANPEGYGRVIRERPSYRVLEVRPYAEISEEEKEINEINSGIYVIKADKLRKYLPLLSRENKKNEYYLSDIMGIMEKDGQNVEAYVLEDAQDILNINDRVQLAYAAKILKKRINQRLMYSGVSIEDPDTAYISPDVEIGKDTVVLPNTHILGKCKIGEGNFIGPNCMLDNVEIGDENKISVAIVRNVKVGSNEVIGPFEKREK